MKQLSILLKVSFSLALSFALFNSASATNPVSVSATTGTGGPYATLYAAFTAINAGTFHGAIVVSLNGNTIENAGSPVLNSSGTGSASYTSVLIKPTVACTVTGSISTAIIKLNGADSVTIDGSTAPGGVSQDLTISNTNTGTTSAVIWIASATGNGATNCAVKNCIITGNTATTTFAGIISGGNGAIGTYDPQNASNTNTLIQHNVISNAQWGIDEFGPTLSADTGTSITGNLISSLGQLGIYIANQYNMQVNNNTITGVNYKTAHGTMAGINAAFTLTGPATSISENRISQVKSTGLQSSGVGILISGAWPVGGSVNGNTINNIEADSANASGIEIFPTVSAIYGGTFSGNNIYTIVSKAVVNTTYITAGASGIFLAVNSSYSRATNLTISNNFISDVTALGYATPGVGNLKYNGNGIVVYSGRGYHIYFNSVNLAANQTQAGQSACLYIANNGPAADSLYVQDNIFTNGETTGSAYGVYSEVPKTGFLSMDYNDYYAATLGYVVTTTCSTLGAIQTNFGGNTHSCSILPSFASGTDLHLTANNNFCLASGLSLAGITTDIDGDTRTVPDMGADEFTFSFDSTTAPIGCLNTPVLITLYYGASTLPAGNYAITYSLSGSNASTGDTATVVYIAGTTNSGTFTIPLSLLVNTGFTTVTINSISAPVVCGNITPMPVPVAATAFNSAGFTVSNGGSVVPALSISAPLDSICPNAALTFTANPVNGGTSPSYQWMKNGINVGANAGTYADSSLVNNDTITCVMTSNASCASPAIAISDSVAVTVATAPVAAFTDSVAGQQVSFNSSGSTGAISYDWNFGDGVGFSAQPNPVYTYATAGVDTACLTVTGSLGCTSVLCQVVTTVITGLAPGLRADFKIYPDPVSNILTIESTRACSSISIINLLGQEVYQQKINQTGPNALQVDVSAFEPGLYYVKVTGAGGVYSGTVMKQ